MLDENFKFVIPAHFEKAANGDWKVRGLASTEARDQQGEILMQKGMDLTPVDQKKGFLNFDHHNDPANLVGSLDGYKKTPQGLYIEGRLFKNHEKAKHIYGIMSSLSAEDRGKAGLSVEGQIIERDPLNPKIIRKCRIRNVAITFNPVNTDTFVDLAKSQAEQTCDLMKSMSAAEMDVDTSRTYSAEEVVELLQKALTPDGGKLFAPQALALSNGENTDRPLKVENYKDDTNKPTKAAKVNGHTIDNGGTENGMKKHLKPMNFTLYKSHMFKILNDLQTLYPECTRSEIWETLKDRLERKFPELKDWE